MEFVFLLCHSNLCLWLCAADVAALEALQSAEATMTVCEIVTHRIFVGLLHSRHLRRRPALWQHWLDVLDGLGGFVDLVPGRGPGTQQSGPGKKIAKQQAAVIRPKRVGQSRILWHSHALRSHARVWCGVCLLKR